MFVLENSTFSTLFLYGKADCSDNINKRMTRHHMKDPIYSGHCNMIYLKKNNYYYYGGETSK